MGNNFAKGDLPIYQFLIVVYLRKIGPFFYDQKQNSIDHDCRIFWVYKLLTLVRSRTRKPGHVLTHVGTGKLLPLWDDEVHDAVQGPFERHSANDEHRQHYVWKRRREVGHLHKFYSQVLQLRYDKDTHLPWFTADSISLLYGLTSRDRFKVEIFHTFISL